MRTTVYGGGRVDTHHCQYCAEVRSAFNKRVRKLGVEIRTEVSNGCYRTCFFVLGLISSTILGAELLDDYGWEATTSPLGMPTGLAIPVNVEDFVSVSIFAVVIGRVTS